MLPRGLVGSSGDMTPHATQKGRESEPRGAYPWTAMIATLVVFGLVAIIAVQG